MVLFSNRQTHIAKTYLLLAVVAIFAMIASGCTTAASDGQGVASVQGGTDFLEKETPVSELDAAIGELLSLAPADFIGHYPVTESFFYWVADAYGEDVLVSIASGDDYSDSELWYELTNHSIHVLWSDYCRDTGLDAYEYSHIHSITPGQNGRLTIDFCGDINLADEMATTAFMEQQAGGIRDCFSEDLLSEMEDADLFVANNEFAYTAQGEPLAGKAYTFRSDPGRVESMLAIGTDLVTLANNHVWDYGEIGMLDTLSTLSDAGLPYVGAGKDITEACRPQYYIFEGRKIAIVNATQIERSYTYTREATEDMAGVLKTLHSERFCSVIRQAKAHSDMVIACVHWGTEGNNFYGADQVDLANDFVDAGADAIIGGHTHCLQGIEYIGDVPVYYSLGNYWFSSTANMPAPYNTGLARLEITPDLSITARFVPCRFAYGVTRRSEGQEGLDIISEVVSYSTTTEIEENGTIVKK